MGIWAILAAGGNGQRFQNSSISAIPETAPTDKLLAPLAGLPVLQWSTRALLNSPRLNGMVIAAAPANKAIYQRVINNAYGKATPVPVLWADGGATRRQSVANALTQLPDSATEVFIHDAARPLLEPVWLERLLSALETNANKEPWQGMLLGQPVCDTLKQAADMERCGLSQNNPIYKIPVALGQTVDRSRLWQVQTPQLFRRSALEQAHSKVASEIEATDDAQLLELAGIGPVGLLRGPRYNLKITEPDDLLLARAIVSCFNPLRIA